MSDKKELPAEVDEPFDIDAYLADFERDQNASVQASKSRSTPSSPSLPIQSSHSISSTHPPPPPSPFSQIHNGYERWFKILGDRNRYLESELETTSAKMKAAEQEVKHAKVRVTAFKNESSALRVQLNALRSTLERKDAALKKKSEYIRELEWRLEECEREVWDEHGEMQGAEVGDGGWIAGEGGDGYSAVGSGGQEDAGEEKDRMIDQLGELLLKEQQTTKEQAELLGQLQALNIEDGGLEDKERKRRRV